jgi:NitT/TauT family transport system permease protein
MTTIGDLPPIDVQAPRPGVEAPPPLVGVTTTKERRSFLADVVPPLCSFALFIAGWYVFHAFALTKGQRTLLPRPHEILQHGFTERGNPKNPVELLKGLWITARTSMIGFLISIVLGVVLAVLMSRARWAEKAIYPYAVTLQTIPILAIAPLMGQVFGTGLNTRVIVCVIISIFPIITNTLFGLKAAEVGQHDLFTLHKATAWTRLTKLQFPAALPAMFEGFRIAAGLSVIGAIVGELFYRQGAKGLGILIDLYRQRLESPQIFAALILSTLLALSYFVFFGWLRKVVVGKWYQSERR